jgi:hypothetical protein
MGRLYYGVEDYETIRAFDYATSMTNFLVLLERAKAFED